MKAKKLFLLFLFLSMHILCPAIAYHTLTSTTEQKVMGRNFKHIMTSGKEDKDQFFIDDVLVAKYNYDQLLAQLEQKEREEQRMREYNNRKAQVEFVDMMQLEIVTKLFNNIVIQVLQLLDKIGNQALEKFFVFTDATVNSPEQLMQLDYFIQQMNSSIKKKVIQNDVQGIHSLYAQLEPWPARLEKFFQDTVHNAIKKSDDTVMLKELLALVSQSSH